MSDVRPFRGLRPRPDLVHKVAAPPYDVLNSEEARVMAGDNPLSYLHVSKAEIDFPPGTDSHSDEVYRKAAENQESLVERGVLFYDELPSFYVYKLTMLGKSQTGFAIGASVDEYENGLIKKHELTRRDKEDDRARHVDILNANTGPVLLTYRATPRLDAIITEVTGSFEPVYDFVAPDGIGHTLWAVSDPDLVATIVEAFREVPAMYVADGHHRSAAAFRVRNLRRDKNRRHTGKELYNHFLAVTFPDNQLRIMGYHRVVKDLNGRTPAKFLEEIARAFEVSPAASPEPPGLHQYTMFLDGKWYLIEARPGTWSQSDPVECLDCSILQRNLLDPVLGVKDPRTDKRIDFVGGIRGTGELERRCKTDMAVAFALAPVSVGQLMAIADSGAIMPPKSTWFEPKLRDAIVVRGLDDTKE
jgi:uncharacterized protein (DUF1015 family)